MRTKQELMSFAQNQIIVKHENDGGIIAELYYMQGDRPIKVISGGNWEYNKKDKYSIIEAESMEIDEVIEDARNKGINVDYLDLPVKRA